MGKQLRLLATEKDLAQIQETLEEVGDVDILSGVPTADLRDLRPLELLPIPVTSMGRESLFCYLAPRHLPRVVVAERDSAVKVHINLVASHLIEFWRPYYGEGTMRDGRLYYHRAATVAGKIVEKDEAFCTWAETILRRVRRVLKLDKNLKSYVGAEAAELIARGELIVVP